MAGGALGSAQARRTGSGSPTVSPPACPRAPRPCPRAATRQLVERLLEREDFRAFVAASIDCLAEPPETQRRRLVLLARQTLERALSSDEAPVAVFILEEEFHDRDPAVTLAEGVIKARARARARRPRRRPSRAPAATAGTPCAA